MRKERRQNARQQDDDVPEKDGHAEREMAFAGGMPSFLAAAGVLLAEAAQQRR